MDFIMHTAARLVPVLLASAVAAASGCGNRDAPAAASGDREVAVYCGRCETSGTIRIDGEPGQASWPRECPSCGRTGAYASETCTPCGRPVMMMDVRTRGWGVPDLCPHCRRSWR